LVRVVKSLAASWYDCLPKTTLRVPTMSEIFELTVEVSDEEAEALAEYSQERLSEAMKEGLEELASAEVKRDELRRRRPEPHSEDAEELSGEALEKAMRDWLRGERNTDPRLD
jgi:hypothetical protein